MRVRYGALLRLTAAASMLAACSGDASGPKIGPPSAVVVVSGSGQTAAVGTALTQPAVIRVTDAQNQPVKGVTVSFSIAAGGGTLNPSTAVTDPTGLAQTSWTLGTNSGEEQRLEARAAGVTAVASFTATATPGPAATVTKAAGDAQTGPVGAALATELTVRVADQYGNAVNGATVSWNILSGGGAIAPTTSTTGTDGLARARWTLGGTLAGQLASASVSGVGSVTFGATGTPGPVATITVEPANATIGVGGTRQFTATLRDAFNNSISGRTVTWSTQDPNIATVDANGLARGVAAGSVQVSAAAEGKAGSALLVVQAGTVLNPVISAIAPATIVAGETATISGSNFATTPAGNTVTLNGVNATVTAASATQLTVQVPSRTALGCEPTRNVNVVVNVGGNTATRSHPVSTATQRTIARGDVLTLTGDDARCNELGIGSGRYVIAVTNVMPDANTLQGFQLRGAAAAAGLKVEPAVVTQLRNTARQLSPEAIAAREAMRAHQRIYDNNINLIRSMPRLPRTDAANNLSLNVNAPPPPNVGDTLTIKMANPLALSCNNTMAEIRARAVYVGTRGVVLEDVAAPLAGTMDSLYRAVGTEFDNVMYPMLVNNFGDPLQYDSRLDDNQRVFMVFTRRVNDIQGIAGYVLSTDFYPRTACGSSNQAEVFYARVPTSTQSGFPQGQFTAEQWYRQTRTVIQHEVKHIVSFASRFLRAGGNPSANDFEHRWLEEASAMLAEELWARSIFNYAQRGNVGYRASVYCEVRPTGFPECTGKPRSVLDHFIYLHDYQFQVELRSPLGPTANDDFTYYGTGWAFLRWVIDQYASSETAFLRALTNEASLRGSANVAARAGRPIDELLTDFSLATILDDRANFTARPQHTMPSWNVPDIFTGLATDFPTAFVASPLARRNVTYGDFSVSVTELRGGSVAVFELSGTQSGKQLLELRGATGGAPATNLRVSIVRVE